MNEDVTVLMGFGESFAAIESAWSLQEAGYRVVAFARAGRRVPLRRVPGVAVRSITAPELSIEQSLKDVASLVEELRPQALLPLDDHALWLTRQLSLGALAFVGPDDDGTALALDKALQMSAAAEAGFAVPHTVHVSDGALPTTEFPCVLKPALAVRVDGDKLVRDRGAVCADRAELETARERLNGALALAQPLLHGTGEGVFGFARDGEAESLSAHRRVRMVNPEGSASSACRSVDVPQDLREPVRALIRNATWSGPFMVETLRDTIGTPWFMELNGRLWGSLALARRRGYEYPAWSVQSALHHPREPAERSAPPHLTARHLGREIVHVAFVVRGPSSRAVSTWPNLTGTLRDVASFRRGERLYNWQRRQPQVLLADTAATIADQLSGRRRANR